MSEFVEVLLKKIPSILFEAIAVAGLLGILLAAFFHAKRPFGKFYWLIAGALIFMLSWRIAIQIVSSRYAEILLYPAVIASVYACFKFSELIYPLFKKYISEKVWRFLPYALVCGLCIACFCRTIFLNPYDPIRTMTNMVRADYIVNSFQKALILTDDTRNVQYNYYAKMPVRRCRLSGTNGNFSAQHIWAMINNYKRSNDVLYFFHIEGTKSKPFQLLVGNKPHPNFILLGQEYVNRREKKVLRVYRYAIPRSQKKK